MLLINLLAALCALAVVFAKPRKTHNNVLLILADDLGYGDTSVHPFVGLRGVKTPNLQRMADKGTVLMNYHTAAATCTPTRASILTGMYPWRMGIKAVYEYGERFKSNRDDWLPPLPTIPMVLSEANFTVFHSGKWHLGGMRIDDHTLRTLPNKNPHAKGGQRCPHPGPNQQGFVEYASVLDGPGAQRQNHLQYNSRLYSEGCRHMLYNDIPVGQSNQTGYLSKCESEHAMRAMDLSVAQNKPFYIQTWFHCPHGPLEEVPGWRHLLPEQSRKKHQLNSEEQYITMIADMDEQIGKMLAHLEKLGIEQDTLVVFTSDNGPEYFAGKTAGLKGSKRHLYEGGIRVPAIVQWVDTVPAKVKSDVFVVSTDLFPTFMDVAGVKVPSHLRLDGISVLPQLIPDYYDAGSVFTQEHAGNNAYKKDARVLSSTSHAARKSVTQADTLSAHPKKPQLSNEELKNDPEQYKLAVRDRVTLWHNDYEGPRRTLAWVYDYKVFLDEHEMMFEMYDMQNDKFETKNLLYRVDPSHWAGFKFTNESGYHQLLSSPSHPSGNGKAITLDMILKDRTNHAVHVWIASQMFRVLKDYATYGNTAYVALMKANPGWYYVPTLESDYRIPGKRLSSTPRTTKANLIEQNTCGVSLCSCTVKTASVTPTLPFSKLPDAMTKYFQPGKILDGSKLLKLKRTEPIDK